MSQIVNCKYYIFSSENSPHNFPASKQFEFFLKIISGYRERIVENSEYLSVIQLKFNYHLLSTGKGYRLSVDFEFLILIIA